MRTSVGLACSHVLQRMSMCAYVRLCIPGDLRILCEKEGIDFEKLENSVLAKEVR